MNKPVSRVDALLHPVRYRVVTALHGRELTPQQLHQALGDVPVATLYRHINVLLQAGVLAVTSERQAYGTRERMLAIAQNGDLLRPEEAATLTGPEIEGLATLLTGSVRAAFAHYAHQTAPLPRPRELAMLVDQVVMTDEEYDAFRAHLVSLWSEALARAETPDRRRRQIAFFSVPEQPGHFA